MPRLNIKSTKAAFVKELKELEELKHYEMKESIPAEAPYAQERIIALAKELEIEIKPEDYKA